jgi:hypothetical protein
MSTVDALKLKLEEINKSLNEYLKKTQENDKKIEQLNKQIDELDEIRDNVVKEQFNIDGKVRILKSQEEDIKKEIDKLENKIVDFKNIQQLIPHVKNDYQQQILIKIISDAEYAKIYLSGYETNTDIKKKDVIGTIKVLGTYNEKKKVREEYDIKIHKDSPKGHFWCSCADHKFNSSKKGTVCKHICFVVCKVLKVLQPYFFETKKLKQEHLDALLQKLTSDVIWKDNTVVKNLEKITLETFKSFIKQLEDCCPVCFNDLEENEKPHLLACPTCHNYAHKECMEVWLEQQERCMLCKSDVWKNYGKVKNGSVISKQMII